jgi:hypothetical protein
MIEFPFRLHRRAAAPLVPPDLPIEHLKARLAERHSVVVDDVAPMGGVDAIDRAIRRRKLARRAPPPQALSAGVPSHMFYEDAVDPHRDCHRVCAPICQVARSLLHGELFNLVSIVTERPRLRVTNICLRACVKGSHVDPSVAQPGIEAIWCGARWDPAYGGHLRLGDDEPIVPRYGALFIRETRQEDISSMSLVTEHGPLVLLHAWFEGLAE